MKNISFDTGVKIFMTLAVLEWIGIIWFVFHKFDVVPDQWEEIIKHLL
ncbi:MAG: hypothetical protein [Podoviridae sp. ctviO18]|nr:MAG: hypothetical protein [Podoviridae sp. ctviO18]